MMNRIRVFVSVCIIAAANNLLASDITTNNTDVSGIESASKHKDANSELVYEQFKLNQEEWRRFQIIKQGPLGYSNPEINPLLALAMYSRDENEIDKYIETMIEHERFIWNRGKEIAKRYAVTYSKLYPNEMPINQDVIYDDPNMIHPSDRFVLMVNSSCLDCNDKVKAFISNSSVLPRNGIDIYVQDAESNDQVISWARTTIPESELAKRDITINKGTQHLTGIMGMDDIKVVVIRNNEAIPLEAVSNLIPR